MLKSKGYLGTIYRFILNGERIFRRELLPYSIIMINLWFEKALV